MAPGVKVIEGNNVEVKRFFVVVLGLLFFSITQNHCLYSKPTFFYLWGLSAAHHFIASSVAESNPWYKKRNWKAKFLFTEVLICCRAESNSSWHCQWHWRRTGGQIEAQHKSTHTHKHTRTAGGDDLRWHWSKLGGWREDERREEMSRRTMRRCEEERQRGAWETPISLLEWDAICPLLLPYLCLLSLSLSLCVSRCLFKAGSGCGLSCQLQNATRGDASTGR